MRNTLLWLFTATICGAMPLMAGSAESPVDFNRDIRPILADACYHCHGPDKNRRKADLRFDQEESAKKVIAAGKLIQRVASNVPAERMPPANAPRQLSKEQIDLLKRWVGQGAKWQKHWAFISPVRLEPPAVKNTGWTNNPIDRFVLARLEKENLAPSPRAALTTLIRRVSLDLTGLPPSPEEVNDFVRESAAKPRAAYEKVVDRLLASPRYGERMAWRWLEAARYADTHGYQTDGERDMYRWRDWVIDAYNRNLPFDQFTIEQIAGDMLPNATLDQKIATGFNRNHRGNSEGGIVPEEYAVEYVVDRVETTSTVWLGLTLGCARCHDHKYDPFSQKEFYQLFAYFNSIPEKGRAVKLGNSPPLIKAPTREQQWKLASLRHELFLARSELTMGGGFDADDYRDWLKAKAQSLEYDWFTEHKPLLRVSFDDNQNTPSVVTFRNGRRSFGEGKIGKAVDLDGKRFVEIKNAGDFGFQDKFSFTFWVLPRSKNGAIVSHMVEEPQADGYSICLVNGKPQIHLTKRWFDDAIRVEAAGELALNRWQHVGVTYDGSRSARGIKVYIDGELQKTRILLDELNQSFNNTEPLRIGSGGGNDSRFNGRVDELRIYGGVLSDIDVSDLSVVETIGQLMRVDFAKLNVNQKCKLANCFAARHAPADFRARNEKMARIQKELEDLEESLPTVMVMEELRIPKPAYILIRGEYDKHGERVNRAVPAAITPQPRFWPSNRLGLAKWLVDAKNPLAARVAVNRIWQLHFGTGLVKTVEDFGTQGEYPSHPELLDWLATEFVRSGWDVKKLHKLIVTSATYQQASRISNELRTKDPENRLLARGPRYRLSAEMVRDQALFASGLLVEKLGGPSVKPYQPPGLWKELSGTDDYKQDKGENLYRRSLYTFWKRTSAPPGLMTFDASARETCWVRETRTNTPLQALTLLNDVTYVEAARMLAERVIKEQKSVGDRLDSAFKLVVSRTPTEAERSILTQALTQHLSDYRKNPEAAKKLLRIGDKPADAKIDPGELAAYAQVCSLILNLDEAVTKE